MGPAALTYQTIISALGPAIAQAFGAMPHANGGSFHWQGFAQATQAASAVVEEDFLT